MGGVVGVTIRQDDGTVHKMSRWTNSLPYFINDLGLIKKHKRHLNGYLKQWFDMVKDYDSGKKKLNMSEVYATHRILAPIDYGLVVVDYQSKTILHMQGYTMLGTILACDIHERRTPADEKKILAAMHKSGLFKKVMCYDARPDRGEKENKFPIIDIDQNWTFEEFMHQCTINRNNNGIEWQRIVLDMSPWKIVRFNETKKGLDKFKENVIKLGFVLTEEEKKTWSKFKRRLK